MKLLNNILTVVYSPAVLFCAAFCGALPTNAASLAPTNTSRIASSTYPINIKDTNNNSVQNGSLKKFLTNIKLAQTTTATIRTEAESMTRNVYRLESITGTSGGRVISLAGNSAGETGTATTSFSGTAGSYDVVVAYYDESDGVASLSVKIKGNQVDAWSLNQNLNDTWVSSKNLVKRTVAKNITLNPGDVIEIQGTENSGEFARVDYIELVPTSQASSPPPTSSISWTERILNADGSINWQEYTNVAQNYHKREMIDYRFGPKHSDFYATEGSFPTVYQPSADGILRLSGAGGWCRVNPGPDGDPGGAWIMSGQMLFSPDTNASADYLYGSSNMRGSDGAISFTDNGLCLRIRPEWLPDWWNRNNISNPKTPSVKAYYDASGGTLPLPPIATARGVGGASVTGFLAFQNGFIGISGTGNDPYNWGSGANYISAKLAPGKVPTAMAITPNNEFVLVTVWDTVNRKGQLAVLVAKNPQMAQSSRYYWGVGGWPVISGLKVLGYIDLPFAAPNAIDVTMSTRLGNPRGRNDNVNDDFNFQSVRDKWNATPWDTRWGDNYWRQMAHSGYALVSSRAENKVAFIDLRPLLKYYRTMYLTTQDNFNQTKNEGTASNQWPFTFDYAPAQKPVVAKVLTIDKPTAVATGNDWNSFKRQRLSEFLKIAYVASMDGTVRMYDVSSLILPNAVAAVPDTPFKSFQVGKNPVQIFHGYHSTTNDDLYIVSRGDRSIHYVYADGTTKGVLRDSRLKDPVNLAVSFDQAGYGGSGAGKTVYVNVMTVMDFYGKQVVNYMVDDGLNLNGEQLNLIGPDGNKMLFQHGFSNPVNGNPFMFTLEEVI